MFLGCQRALFSKQYVAFLKKMVSMLATLVELEQLRTQSNERKGQDLVQKILQVPLLGMDTLQYGTKL